MQYDSFYSIFSRPNKFEQDDQVIAVTDKYSFGHPMNEPGIVLGSQMAMNVKVCAVRFPAIKQTWLVPEDDLIMMDDYVNNSINEALRQYLITESLDTRNEELFFKATGSNSINKGGMHRD